jgi:hypothetical protein
MHWAIKMMSFLLKRSTLQISLKFQTFALKSIFTKWKLIFPACFAGHSRSPSWKKTRFEKNFIDLSSWRLEGKFITLCSGGRLHLL